MNSVTVKQTEMVFKAVCAEFAHTAKNRCTMYMKDWITKLDDFLALSEHDILTHAGKITHDDAIAHANAEFDKFKQRQLEEPSAVEGHFEESLRELARIEKSAAKKGNS